MPTDVGTLASGRTTLVEVQAIILRPRHLDRPRSDSGWPNDLSDQTAIYPQEAVAALSPLLF